MMMNNIFIEGTQGAGKSTLLGMLSDRLLGYRLYREGDFSPVELAWCSFMDEPQYGGVLEKFPNIKSEIEKNTIKEGSHYVTMYTRIITDEPGFHKYMEQFEIYNGNVSAQTMKNIILERYRNFSGEGNIFECSLFQNCIECMMLFFDLSDKEIIDFYLQVHDALNKKEIRILYLKSDDIRDNILHIKKERSDENGNEMWYPLMIRYLEESPYAKKHGIKGLEGLVFHLERRQQLELKILEGVFGEKALILESKKYDEDEVVAWCCAQ